VNNAGVKSEPLREGLPCQQALYSLGELYKLIDWVLEAVCRMPWRKKAYVTNLRINLTANNTFVQPPNEAVPEYH